MLSLTNLSATRSWKQAIVFYIVYTAIMLIFCAIVGGITAVITIRLGYDVPVQEKYTVIAGAITALVTCVTLTVLLIRSKRMAGIKTLLYFAGTFLLAMISGLAGMLIPAYLTTLERAE